MTRTIVHILLGALLWLVFGYYWYLVMRQPITGQTQRALVIVAGIVAIITVFDVFWIFHNARIARFGKRRTRRTAAELSLTDFLGRTYITPGDEAVRAASYIEVHVVEIADDRSTIKHKLVRVSELSTKT